VIAATLVIPAPELEGGVMSSILRFDDYSAISNTALERSVFEAIAEADQKIVVSVVPFVAGTEWKPRGPIPLLPLPDAKIALLRQYLGHIEVALHGYCHQVVSRFSGLTEFNDAIPIEDQLARLSDAKGWLEDKIGTAVDTFVPPWNAYGISTLEALRQAGFKTLSGDAAFGPLAPELSYIPATCSIDQLASGAELARKDRGSFACALVHEYEFRESGAGCARFSLEEFRRFCSRKGLQWVRISDCTAQRIGYERARANQELRSALQSRRRHFFSKHTQHVYWTEAAASAKLRLLKWGAPAARGPEC
jgi:hypothetical protein